MRPPPGSAPPSGGVPRLPADSCPSHRHGYSSADCRGARRGPRHRRASQAPPSPHFRAGPAPRGRGSPPRPAALPATGPPSRAPGRRRRSPPPFDSLWLPFPPNVLGLLEVFAKKLALRASPLKLRELLRRHLRIEVGVPVEQPDVDRFLLVVVADRLDKAALDRGHRDGRTPARALRDTGFHGNSFPGEVGSRGLVYRPARQSCG